MTHPLTEAGKARPHRAVAQKFYGRCDLCDCYLDHVWTARRVTADALNRQRQHAYEIKLGSWQLHLMRRFDL